MIKNANQIDMQLVLEMAATEFEGFSAQDLRFKQYLMTYGALMSIMAPKGTPVPDTVVIQVV